MSAGEASRDAQLPGLTVDPGPLGTVGQAVQRSVAAAALDDRDEGAGALAVSLARAVDAGHRRGDPYAVATAGRELREQLQRLRLDPVSRLGNDAGGVTAFLASLGPAPAEPEAGADRGS